ncbi:hypothetical protein PLANPX_3129 [Lacipirellula parvula]|uniref:Uncharacterized protein n=1 Tax=Lacipirellula parvula TaxID=2650471 RepID=A0A5K7XBW1_9BACT|nr:hypothetical protein PLANPX_3129 [Lacipirellula parvula]
MIEKSGEAVLARQGVLAIHEGTCSEPGRLGPGAFSEI